MKKTLSILLALAMLLTLQISALSVNEPTTGEMEKIIKIVKPKLDVHEDATEFSWNYYAGNVYSDPSWRLVWKSKDNTYSHSVSCDAEGRITSYSVRNGKATESTQILPKGTRAYFEETASNYIKKLLPDASSSLKLDNSFSNGIYSKSYTYNYVRYENGFPLHDNTVSVTLNYITGDLMSLKSNFTYDIEFNAPTTLIGEEKAKELLSSQNKMELTYISRNEIVDDKSVVKAVLVYAPQGGYAAIDAISGEIYNTKSDWSVSRDTEASITNEKAMLYSYTEEAVAEDAEYELNEEEKAQLSVLEKLITKETAIKSVTENKALYMPAILSAVEGTLNKNHQSEKSYYQDDRGSYTWSLHFSNPVINDGDSFKRYSYAQAVVNADNGNLVSFYTSLASYWDYIDANEKIPDVKYTMEQAQEIAEGFLNQVCKDKFENTVLSSSRTTNVISYRDAEKMESPIYGAYKFTYMRENEGIEYNGNYITIGIDGVTGKVFDYSYRWNTNIEFQSPKGAMTPQEALEHYINLGTSTIYEICTSYIYTPANDKSKQEVMKAFVLSIMTTLEQNGDIAPIIKKYASDIDEKKLLELIGNGDEEAVFDFVGDYYGVTVDEKLLAEYESSYSDIKDFYSKQEYARLVYTLVFDGIRYVDPFDGKGLNYSGLVPEDKLQGYTYSDIEGHWAKETIELLGEIGIGFAGGKFEPEKEITGKEFCGLANKLSFNVWDSSKPAYYLKDMTNPARRIDAVKYILTSIDYDKVAVLQNIFRTEFADNAEIKEEDIGFVAIAHALEIVHGNGEVMRTYDNLTRAEAVTLLVKAAPLVR